MKAEWLFAFSPIQLYAAATIFESIFFLWRNQKKKNLITGCRDIPIGIRLQLI